MLGKNNFQPFPPLSTFFIFLVLLLAISCANEQAEIEIDFEYDDGPHILVIGDSILDFNSWDGESVPDFLADELGEEVINRAVGGSYFTNSLESDEPMLDIRNQYVEGAWDWLIVDGGGNDFNSECGCGDCTESLDDLISEDGQSGAVPDFVNDRTDAGIRVIFLGYYLAPPTAEFGFDRCPDIVTRYKERLTHMAEENPLVWFVDAAEVVDPADLALYAEDHIHPSPAGAALIAQQLAAQIEAIGLER